MLLLPRFELLISRGLRSIGQTLHASPLDPKEASALSKLFPMHTMYTISIYTLFNIVFHVNTKRTTANDDTILGLFDLPLLLLLLFKNWCFT